MTLPPRDLSAPGATGPSGVSKPAIGPRVAPSTPRTGGRAATAPTVRPEPKPTGPVQPDRKGRPSPETFAHWDRFFANPKHDSTPARFLEHIALLRQAGQIQDVEAAIIGYLRHRGKDAESWMYESLAVATEFNQGGADRVKAALDSAANLAEKKGDPDSLVGAADMLFIRGRNDRVGPLLDKAMEKVPHRPEPVVMSINLARKTKDPKRMEVALDRLLSLGWPGVDETLRREARRQAEGLAKTLKSDGRAAEADALLARLAEGETRDLLVRLTWEGDADLDLVVDEPLGASAHHDNPRTVFGGSIVKEGQGKHPEEVYVCPRAFDGDYKVRIKTIYNDPDKPIHSAKLEIITHQGAPGERKETQVISLARPAPVVVNLKGGRRKSVLPITPLPFVVVPRAEPDPVTESPKSSRGLAQPSTRPGVGMQPRTNR